MITDELISGGRTLAESLMIDTGVISRPSSAEAGLNTTTGLLTPAATATVHTGPCRVRMPTAVERETLFGDEPVTSQRFVISFKHNIAAVQVGDTVAVTSTGDGSIAARRFRVCAVESRSVLHSCRLAVETVEDDR